MAWRSGWKFAELARRPTLALPPCTRPCGAFRLLIPMELCNSQDLGGVVLRTLSPLGTSKTRGRPLMSSA